MLQLRIYFILICLFLGCKSRQLSSETLFERELIFGSGGGFTGVVKTYILKGNGTLTYLESMKKDTVILSVISKKECQKIFKKLSELHLEDKTIKRPGNIYYFLKEKKQNKYSEVVWGDFNYTVPDEINSFYKSLYQYIKH